jgi:hypothetical protein
LKKVRSWHTYLWLTWTTITFLHAMTICHHWHNAGVLGQFNTNYIIFRNIEIFKEIFFSKIKFKNMMKYLGIYHLSYWDPQN